MLTLLIVAAEKMEFSGIAARCTNVRKAGWNIRFGRSAEWKGCRLLLAANGPGPALSGAAVDEAGTEKVDAIIEECRKTAAANN